MKNKAVTKRILLKQAKLNCEWLRSSKKETESNIAYINYLQSKDLILVPSMNRKEDETAFNCISDCFPEYSKNGRIKQIDMTEIVRHGGALNCISWTIKNVPQSSRLTRQPLG